MKTAVAIIVVALVAVGVYFLFTHKVAAPTTSQEAVPAATSTDQGTNAGVSGGVSTTITVGSPVAVSYTNAGFVPSTVTSAVGQTVTWKNNSSHQMWVASGMHPIHSQYDGTALSQHCSNGTPDSSTVFDECVAVAPGASYSFTFTKAGSWQYHNHVGAQDTGTVVVK